MAGRTVTTILKLNDQMSGKLKKIQKVSTATSKDVQSKAMLIGKKFQAAGEKVSNVGKAMTVGITGPIAGVAAASMAAWKEVDEGMDTVIKKTGATGEELKGLQKSVENIATSIPTSFAEAGEAVGEVNTRFGITGDELEDLTKKFIEFSSLNGTDLTTTIDSMQSAMEAFGVSAEDAGDFLDTVNAAAQQTGVDVNTLTEDMKKNAVAMKEMGYNASDSALFLANLDKNGVDTGAAMTALKKGLVEATKNGQSMGDAMAELQSKIKNAPSDTEAYAAAMEMFGNRSGAAIADAVREGRLSLDELNTSLSDFSGNVEKTFNEAKDPTDDFQQNLNKVKLIGADIGNTVMPVIATAMEKVSEVLNKVKGAWDGLSEQQKQTILKVAGILAILGPALMIAGKIISVIGTIISVVGVIIPKIMMIIGLIGKVISVLKIIIMVVSVITGLPAIAVVAIAAAVVAAIALIIKFRKQIADFFIAIFNKIVEFGGKVKAKITDFKETAVSKFKEIGEGIKQALVAPFEWITGKIDAFKEGVGSVVDKVKGAAGSVRDKVTGNNATGTSYWKGGRTWVGEHGPEVVDLPKGSKVYPHTKSANMGQAPNINLSINIQGNVIGNEDFANMISEKVCGNLSVALAN